MRKKTAMYHTFKTAIFSEVTTMDGRQVPAVEVISGHLVINEEHCDLRPIKERYNVDTKVLVPSAVERILTAESVLATHFGKRVGEQNTLFDFITVDCSGGNDFDAKVKQVKDLLCFDGLYVPLAKLEVVGYVPHDAVEVVTLEGVRYVHYRAAIQSASENRQCKFTMTTFPWADIARTISSDAQYLSEPTQTVQKAIARQGLGKTNGNIINDFAFTFARVPDLETEITFNARCFNDAQNEITAETITATKNATDGCGFITPAKARELARRLELNYVPSAFQIRYGQVKGILLVFDFRKYSGGIVKEDILFTDSMWKADFNVANADLLIANISKEPRNYAAWNYQMFSTLNNWLSFDDILPYVEDVKHYMERALSSPEDALKFLGILNNIASQDSDEGSKDEYDCVDKVSAVIQANPQLAMNIRWVKQAIKRKIDLVSKKMLAGKLPMPESSIAIMGADPLAYFNRLRVDEAGNYGFTDGVPVVPTHKQARELAAHEFYRGGHQGELLAFRNPLTHHAQIRKLACVAHENSMYWYKHLNQVVLFNAFDETAAGMGGSDFDGDMCFLSSLFVDKFEQADYIIYNANDIGDNQEKVILTEEAMQQGIRTNLQQSMLGVICNINTRALELMNDATSLQKFIRLAGYKDDVSFGYNTAQMPYLPKFKDMGTAKAYLEGLNHQLTTLSELEVDRPKTGYINRFCQNQQEYALPFMPYWFGNVKGQADAFFNRPPESISQNHFGERVRTLTKHYDSKVVKSVIDTLKYNPFTRKEWVQRTVELMTDGNTIMGQIQRYVQQNILDMEVDATACYSIVESLKGASCLDMEEAERIMPEVLPIFKGYCRDIAANIQAMKSGAISDDEFNDALDYIIAYSDGRLRTVSSDRAAIAYASYVLSLENGYGSQSFPFLTALDGMVALLSDVRRVDYFDIRVRHSIPAAATHLIVHNRRFRLPESVCAKRIYFGEVNLPDGSYELHRDLKGGISIIVPRVAKHKLNIIPYNDEARFSLKISYKASELAPENQHGAYVTRLMANSIVSFRETTMNGNTQYCVYAGDTWVGTLFDDQTNTWVLKKDIALTLMGKVYSFVGVPRTGAKVNSNTFITATGKARTAQVLTFMLADGAQTQIAA